MAFQSINNRGPEVRVKASGIAVGESIIAYAVKVNQFTHEEKDYHNIIMQKEDGEQFELQTCGTLMYDVKDNRIKMGLLTKVTKLADKGGKEKRARFEVLQDPEKTLDDVAFAAITSTIANPAVNLASTKAAVDRASIKAQAQRLTDAVGGRK